MHCQQQSFTKTDRQKEKEEPQNLTTYTPGARSPRAANLIFTMSAVKSTLQDRWGQGGEAGDPTQL